MEALERVEPIEGYVVYRDQIESLFHQYFSDRNIDIETTRVHPDKFNNCWSYIYKTLFKPDIFTKRINNRNSKIDYSNIDTLNDICDTYIDLCEEYCIPARQYGFSKLTGISTDTLNMWDTGKSRGYLYYTLDGVEIKNINDWIANGKTDYRRVASSAYSDLVKKIKRSLQAHTQGDLDQTPVGQITLANNDEEVGLMYAQKEAQAKAEAWGRRPMLTQEQILGIEQADGPEADF